MRILANMVAIFMIFTNLYSLAAQDNILEFPLEQRGVGSFDWRPNGTAIAIDIGTGIAIYDSITFSQQQFFESPTNIRDLAWSPNGLYLAAALDNGEIDIFTIVDQNWELETKLVGLSERQIVVYWQPTGNKLISLGQDVSVDVVSSVIHVWDTEVWELEKTSTLDLDFNSGGSGLYPFQVELAFSETEIILSLGRSVLRINLSDLQLTEEYVDLTLEAPLSYSVNGANEILIGTANQLRLYDLSSENTIFTDNDARDIYQVEWHPDGVTFAYGYTEAERKYTTIKSTEDPDFAITLADLEGTMAWNSSGDRLAIYQFPSLYIYQYGPCTIANLSTLEDVIDAVGKANQVSNDVALCLAPNTTLNVTADTFFPEIQGSVSIIGDDTIIAIDSEVTGHFFDISAIGSLTLENITLTGGNADMENGGAIRNAGNLTLRNVTLTDNSAANGGAIYNTGTLVIEGSELRGNTASAQGGAIWTTGDYTITDSLLIDNSATEGSAIYEAE